MTTSAADHETDIRAAFELVTTQSAEQFERISALCQTLLLLLRSPLHYDAPWLASLQVEAMLAMASQAASSLDQVAEQAGYPRTDQRDRELLEARAAFLRKL